MYKNWPAITAEANPSLRMLAVTADGEILEGLQKGFPRLFSDSQTDLYVPLSAIQRQQSALETILWDAPLKALEIPYFEWAVGSRPGVIGGSVPKQWRDLMAEHAPLGMDAYDLNEHAKDPIVVEWEGEECFVCEAFDYEPDDNHAIGGLTIVPTRFLDLSS